MAGYSHTIESTLKNLSGRFGIGTFVETGTFNGYTAEIASCIFEKVYTIEISEDLFEKAQKKFAGTNVRVFQGDSPDVLKKLLPEIREDAVFFLDAHWAGDLSSRGETDTPLSDELKVISQRENNDVIIIDDVSFFNRKSELEFKPGSQYFPNGGIFKWDWRHINKESIIQFLEDREVVEVDDRLIFTRS